MVKDFINQFTKIVNKFNLLQSLSFDFGTGELLSPSEIHTIDAIGNNHCTVTEISLTFSITKGAVSQLITKLNSKGYVKKERNKLYSKEVILSLTDKGQVAYQSHKNMHALMDDKFIELIENSPEEYVQYFNNVLIQVENYIDKFIDTGK